MKLALIVAFIVGLFCAFCAVQAYTWPVKPVPNWHPEWWQVSSLVEPGFAVLIPGGLATALLEKAGVHSTPVLLVVGGSLTVITIAVVSIVFFRLTLLVKRVLK